VLSIIAIEYPLKRPQYFAYTEAVYGLGTLSGPLIGGFLYVPLGFRGTFYCLGGVFILIGLITFLFIPNRINYISEDFAQSMIEG
jgi:MFS family permease